MKRLYLGVLLTAILLSLSTSTHGRVKRFSGNDQRSNEWNWNRGDQMIDGSSQTKGTSQANWGSTKGSGGSTKGRVDSSMNRDGSWGTDNWSSGENMKGGYDMQWSPEPQGNTKGSAYPDGAPEEGGNLEVLLRGIPGMDFPDFATVPNTDFDCSLMPSPQGYYGDVEAGCQVFHICQPGNRKDSFLCPVGTIFNQKYFVCDWWFNVNCSETPSYYDLNNEVYKDPVAVTTEVPVTTEKMLPWSSQDLDKKRPPTKSWGNQPPMGKTNTQWKDTPNRRGSKSDSVATSREFSNSWSQSDAQKEVTFSWGTSSGAAAGTYGSSSTASNSIIPTTKPIWYGSDGQPSKDQSNGMAKRNGLFQTPAPFGTRMRGTSRMGRANTWSTTEVYQPTTAPMNSYNYGPSSRDWMKGDNEVELATQTTREPSYTTASSTRGWFKNEVTRDISINDGNNGYVSTSGWLKSEDIPETSINPTGIKGVWELGSTRSSDHDDQSDVNAVGHKGIVTSSDNSTNKNKNKYQAVSNQRNEWGQRQTSRNVQSSTATNRGWFKQNFEKQKQFESTNLNSIPRRKNWK